MKRIRLIACDTDGVILKDTFSPILYKMSKILHIPYTEDMERNTFSRNNKYALQYIQSKTHMSKSQMISIYHIYFEERRKYIKENHVNPIVDGAYNFLHRLRKLNVKIICYGGLPLNSVDSRAKPLINKFDRYICTGKFRPGLKEIIKNFYHLNYSNALFIDDVNTVAEEAKKYDIPFIGDPTDHPWGFQKQDMQKTGVKYMVHSVNNITINYIKRIDTDGGVWSD